MSINREDVEKAIKEHVAKIAVSAVGLAQAKERATSFLTVQALILDRKKEVIISKVKLETLANAAYATAIVAASGGAAEKKATAENDDTYKQWREAVSIAEAEEKWLAGYYEIFGNAHVCYRQYSKD